MQNDPTTTDPLFLNICKDLPPELKELILAYAVMYASEERKWKLGDTLKKSNPQDFDLFNWVFHLFRQRSKLIVEVEATGPSEVGFKDCSYKDIKFNGLSSIINLPVGSEESRDFNSRNIGFGKSSETTHIDWESIRSLPMGIRALALKNAVIHFPTVEATERLVYSLSETIEFLQCTPDQLKFFSTESTKNLRSLTLDISDVITERHPCWNHLPTKVHYLYLEGQIPKKALLKSQIKRADDHPLKLGGMTIPKQANYKIVLVLKGLRIFNEEKSSVEYFSRFQYATINYDEDINYFFPIRYYTCGKDWFFNIDVISDSARLEIFEQTRCPLYNKERLFNHPSCLNNRFFLKFPQYFHKVNKNCWLTYDWLKKKHIHELQSCTYSSSYLFTERVILSSPYMGI
ncbi:unnamed protein product [Ambrosiozyma monospora]|uniref:Unnamed protein product n=1 Tax=Ambrosiozyma monospora TaxID=43982 RepID=A0ACB5T3B2_AMBMO|nr:unnamed protein product [Ambrosiozyma monospora]